MYVEAIGQIRNSIFPILFEKQNDGSIKVGVSGTGFFVGESGHFVTACHVIDDIPVDAVPLYAGNIPRKPLKAPMRFTEVLRNDIDDVFVGRLEQETLPPVHLANERAATGQSICLCGYPLAIFGQDPNGSINVDGVRQYWQPTFAIDQVVTKQANRVYEGFLTQHTSLKGMSGGPVFGPDGLVYGMDVATMTRIQGASEDDTVSVPNGVVVGVETIRRNIDQALAKAA